MTLAIPSLDRLPAAERGITIADFLVPIRVGERLSTRARHIALIAAGAVFIYLCARVVIPIAGNPVPITGQTFGVLLVGGALGFRRGLASVLLYVLLGVVGLPFFAEGRSGLAIVFGASGGYLIGFILAGALVGRLAELGWDRHIAGAVGAMAVGNALIYLIGVPWLAVVTGADAPKAISL
jgi:biotin transport system substrate-specific component